MTFEYDLATNNSGYYGCGRFIRHLLAMIAALEASTAGDVKSSSTFFFSFALTWVVRRRGIFRWLDPSPEAQMSRSQLEVNRSSSFAGLASGTGG